MKRRTTIELDDALLSRAKRALGCRTTRETVETALRRAAEDAEAGRGADAEALTELLDALATHADLGVMGSEEMWR